MARDTLGTVEQLDAAGRLLGRVGDRHVAVFRVGDGLVAYENRCPHLGGPVCAGKLFRRVVASVEADEVVERFSEDEVVLNCPWHGMEFDLATGVCNADPRRRLRSLQATIEGGNVVVEA